MQHRHASDHHSTFAARNVVLRVQVRTSYGMFIPRYQDPVIANVEQRLSKWLGIPAVHQEDMQVRFMLHST